MIKHTYEYVKGEFEKEGYNLLSTTYEWSKAKLDVVCPNGHHIVMKYGEFKSGRRCNECKNPDLYRKASIVKQAFINAGYTQLSDYIGTDKPISLICDKGHNVQMTWTSFNRGHRCKYCNTYQGKKCALSNEEIKASFASEGYTMLGDYINSDTPIPFKCPAGHIHKIRYSSWKEGQRCYYCVKYVDPDMVRGLFESESYTLHDAYKTWNTKMRFTCPVGHVGYTTWNNWQCGRRCQSCSKSGFDYNKPGILYYIRFTFEGCYYYKIGVTNRTVKERFHSEPLPYTIIQTTSYPIGSLAYKEEQRILNQYAEFKYKGCLILESGNTELFISDVLGLDIVIPV